MIGGQRGSWSPRPEERRPTSPLAGFAPQRQGSRTYIPGAVATIGVEQRRDVERNVLEEFAQDPNEEESEWQFREPYERLDNRLGRGFRAPTRPPLFEGLADLPSRHRSQDVREIERLNARTLESQAAQGLRSPIAERAQEGATQNLERPVGQDTDHMMAREMRQNAARGDNQHGTQRFERFEDKAYGYAAVQSQEEAAARKSERQKRDELIARLLAENEKEDLEEDNFRRGAEGQGGKQLSPPPAVARRPQDGARPDRWQSEIPHSTAGAVQPEHMLLRQRDRNQAVGSTYLPEGALPPRADASRHSESTGHMAPPRRPIQIEPILHPVGIPGAYGPAQAGVLYGPPLPIYHNETRGDVAAKSSTTPRLTPFYGNPEDEGQKARHFMGLVEMHASVTKGIMDKQKILIVISNMKGPSYDWFFNTNNWHAELYGGRPLFDSFEKFRQLFLQRFGQINTATAMAQLDSVKLKKNETVATFAQMLENLFFSANLVDEQAKLYYFFRAINDPLKSQVRGCKPLTLAQAIQDAIHFDQRMTKEEQERSRFVDLDANKNKSKPPAVKKVEDKSPAPQVDRAEERPAVGKRKNNFPKKYDPINQTKKKEGGNRQFKKGITCYNCGQEGHYSNTCEEPPQKGKAVARLTQEEEDPWADSPQNEPDF